MQTPWGNFHWPSFRWASWLGWQIESNWTEPWLFVIYVLVKPVAGSLLLVCMFFAARSATQGAVPTAFLPYLYVGNACFALVGAVTFGMSYAVIQDREHYRMLKYIYISPAHLQSYLMGRGLARVFQAAIGALLNLTVGWICFSDIRRMIPGESIAWAWLVFYLVVGVAMLLAMGLILAAAVLNMSRQGMFLSEGVAGVMYLLCGAVFPIGILPQPVQWLSLALPPTYWLEGIRRALFHATSEMTVLPASPLVTWSDRELGLALLLTTLGLALFSRWFFRVCERRAWRLGRLEESTGA